jgi:hypothetical protein
MRAIALSTVFEWIIYMTTPIYSLRKFTEAMEAGSARLAGPPTATSCATTERHDAARIGRWAEH